MARTRPISTAALVVALTLVAGSLLAQDPALPASGAPATSGTMVLAGVVRDTADRPLSGAEVRTANHFVLSEADGTFLLPGVTGDTVQLLVRRIGYRPADVLLTVEPHIKRVELAVKMVPAVTELGTITVEGRTLSMRLMQTGFYQRQKLGIGTFFDAEYLEHFGGTLGGLLQQVPSVQVRYGRGNAAVPMGRSGFGGYCPLQVFLDGVLIRWASVVGLNGLVAKDDILAVEVYRRVSQMPSVLAGHSGAVAGSGGLPNSAGSVQLRGTSTVDCGAVVIWTKPFEPKESAP